MADKPETLEETQARLARVKQGPSLPPPPVSVPIPPVSVAPGTPYGPGSPPAPAPVPPAELGGAGTIGTEPVRPDPYAESHIAPPGLATPVVTTRRPMNVVAIGFAVVALVVIAGVVAFNALQYSDSSNSAESGDDPLVTGDEPEYSEEWQNFPGVSWSDPELTLDQASYEEVATKTDALITEYRDALTAEFGIVWSQTYESHEGLEGNGYGGDSMLYYYDPGTWEGQVRLDDPGARERMFEIFGELTAAYGGDGALLRNEIYSDDPAAAREEFGAEQLEDQALWSFFDSFPDLADSYLWGDVIDRSIPVDDSFTGDYLFTDEGSSGTLYITVTGFTSALLKEGDRDAFEAALEPYHGDYEP